MSEAYKSYIEYFKGQDRFLIDMGLDQDLLDKLTEDERKIVENELVNKFKEGNMVSLPYMSKLKIQPLITRSKEFT